MLNMTVPPNVCQLPDQGKTVLTELALRLVKRLQFALEGDSLLRLDRLLCCLHPMCHQSIFKVWFTSLCVFEVPCEGSLTVKATL